MGEAIILAPCASRKAIKPAPSATAVSLPEAAQTAVETAWSRIVAGLPARKPALELYGGRGFGLARDAAADASADLYVISAGLGLVQADRPIPTYGVTVSNRGEQAISRRVTGRFDPTSWWARVSAGPYSDRIADVVARHPGLVLVALTAPYAAMIGSELADLSETARGRLRLFGQGLASALPDCLASAVMPYDARLNDAVPGTRADFSQRALRHFCRHATIDGSLDAVQNAAEVDALLADLVAPSVPVRPRRSDGEIVALISAHLEHTRGIGRILRLIRDSDGLACEQARFSRLYGQAVAARAQP